MDLFKKGGLGKSLFAKAAMFRMCVEGSVSAASALVGKAAVDHVHLDESALAALESRAVHTHLVFHAQQCLGGLAVIVGRSGVNGFDGHDHHLVPVGISLFPDGILLLSGDLVVLLRHTGAFVSLFLDDGDQAADIGEGVGVVVFAEGGHE